MKKIILITGGCGFIGSNLSEYLHKKNYKVIVIDDLSIGNIKNLFSLKKIQFIKKDILNIDKVKILPKKIDAVIHLAAKAEILISNNKEEQYFKDNVITLKKVLNFCAKRKIKKLIFTSSASVYGDTKNKKISESFPLKPNHYYSFTKYIGEKIIQSYCKINKLDYTILRLFNVYGVKSNAVVAKFIAQKIQKKKLTIYGNGKQERDFIHINDVNEVITQCLKNQKSNNKIYNVGSGNSISIIALKNLITKNKHIHLTKRNDDIEISIANNKKIKKDLNLKFKTDIPSGIKEMEKIDYYRLKKTKLSSILLQKKIISMFNKKS